MARRTLRSRTPAAVVALVLGGLAPAEAATPVDGLLRQIESVGLEPERAVELEQVSIDVGPVDIRIDSGTLVPGSPIDGRTAEMVFLGSGRLVGPAPDPVESSQLSLFTGGPDVDLEFDEAVFVVANDAAALELLGGRPPVAPDPALLARAGSLMTSWLPSPERRVLNVPGALLLDAVRDPAYGRYFAAWFHSWERGDFYLLVEPDQQEQVTLGQFVPLRLPQEERNALRRRIDAEQRRGRLIGLQLEDLGHWDTWMSTSFRDEDGTPRPASSPFEPEHYDLAVRVTDDDRWLQGSARIRLRSLASGRRGMALRLSPDLEVERVTDGDGRPLTFVRSGIDLTVLFDTPPEQDATLEVVVDYVGNLIDRTTFRTFFLRDTVHWYPHAGTVDRATYDVLLEWPAPFDVVASGRRVDGGVRDDGARWQRRRLDVPTLAFGFELGDYRFREEWVGDVRVTIAFDRRSTTLLSHRIRREIRDSVRRSLEYLQEVYGPYPLDELTVVTSPRHFSQSFLGFITLSDRMMDVPRSLVDFFTKKERAIIIAHEMAHQWWGNVVGWKSYRDQWLSEAMANYGALLYFRDVLRGAGQGYGTLRRPWIVSGLERVPVGPTTHWRTVLEQQLAAGRTVESLGPLVLGRRLDSSYSQSAYEAIVYYKGAVVIDMLARVFGRNDFVEMMREIVDASHSRPLTTEMFLAALERMSGGVDLDWFGRSYVYGTGVPTIYYDHTIEPTDDGRWRVRGHAYQHSPYHYRYAVTEVEPGRFDVRRRRIDEMDVTTTSLIVPYHVPLLDADGGGRAAVGRVMIQGDGGEFEIELDHQPLDLWLDPRGEVLADFFSESRQPKRVRVYRAVDSAADGDLERTIELSEAALVSELGPRPAKRAQRRRETAHLDTLAHLNLARLYLDLDLEAEAREALGRAESTAEPRSVRRQLDATFRLIEARLDLRDGRYELAHGKLQSDARGGGPHRNETLALLAIAAAQLDDPEAYRRAVEGATASGVDLAALRRLARPTVSSSGSPAGSP